MALRKPLSKTLLLKNAKLRRPSKGRSSVKAPNVEWPELKKTSTRSPTKIAPKILWWNSERYLGLLAGFFLFIAPFAVFTRLANYLAGSSGEATIHSICYKLPMDILINGAYPTTFGPVAAVVTGAILIVALLFGPLFCGRLCPVGAISEMISRLVPIPARYRMRIQNPKITATLRYGFLAGFILVGWVVGGQVAQCNYGVDFGRYCSPAMLEYLSLGLFSTPPANFWNTGAVMTLLVWLVLGGVMMAGGRGWCLFFCPLGAISGIAHSIGSRIGFYRLEHNAANCRNCRQCYINCPMWAISMDGKIERSLCIGCRECVNNCSFNAYYGTYGWKKREKVNSTVKDAITRVRTAGAFTLAAATAPMAYLVTGPCASTGCAACPLGGACAISIPLLYGGMLLSHTSARFKGVWASLRSRLRRGQEDATVE